MTNHFKDFLKENETKPNDIDKQSFSTSLEKDKGKTIKESSVGFLGPKGTFSHQATLNFSKKSKLIAFSSIKEIFEAVNNEDVDLGLVPAENSIGGIVSDTINKLIEYSLKTTGSFDFPIHHFLLGKTKNIKKLKVIKSHPQALSQCKDWIEKNLPRVKLESSSSTTSPIIANKSKKSIGFIGSSRAAKEYDLNILAERIESTQHNLTKFYVISKNINKKVCKKLKAQKSLVLLAVYDRVGILRDILDVFASEELNLTSLHSVPSRLKPWDYFFFLEVQTPLSSSALSKTLEKIKDYCSTIRVIGAS